jgi:ribosomal protein L40E
MVEMIRQKESSYAAINELEMDHRTGKISDADYKSLYEPYKTAALNAIRALKGWETEEAGFDDIENEVGRRHRELEHQIATAEDHDHYPCSGCGTANEAGRITCSKCGADLRQMCRVCNTVNPPRSHFCRGCGESLQRYCQDCGSPVDAWTRFCSQCGSELAHSRERG